MRIAVFSDIHGNLNGLNAVLESITAQGQPAILVAAGDLVADGPRPKETFDRLVQAGCLLLRGNHEEYMSGRGRETLPPPFADNLWLQNQWAAEQLGDARLELLERQPGEYRFSPPGEVKNHDLLIVHTNLNSVHGLADHAGVPENELEELYGGAGPEIEIIAFGHWHYPSIRRWQDKFLVNVASVAYPKDRAKLAGYTLFDWDEEQERWSIQQYRVPFNWREEAEYLRTCGIPGDIWQIQHFYSE